MVLHPYTLPIRAVQAPAAPKAAEAEPTVDVLDIRVGKIVEVKQHPNAEALYVEQNDLGEGKLRQVRMRMWLQAFTHRTCS